MSIVKRTYVQPQILEILTTIVNFVRWFILSKILASKSNIVVGSPRTVVDISPTVVSKS